MNPIKNVTFYAAMLTLGMPGLTEGQNPVPPGESEAEAYIRRSEAEWAESVANGDSTVLQRILADDFAGVDTGGKVYNKAEQVADTKEAPKYFRSNHLEDVRIRFYGDTAVANGSEAWVRRNGERGRFVWIDTWLKRNGAWQIVAAEDVIAPAAPGPDEEAIKVARTKQNAAIMANKVDEIASYWTDDVTICRGLGVQVSGKAAYRKLFEADVSSPKRVLYERRPRSIQVSDNWPLAFENGVWTGRLGGEKGEEIIGGRYCAQWVKRDGQWLIRSEVFVALTGTGPGLESKAAP